MYNVVQTGPKTQDGGLKEGLFSSGYQVSTEFDVKIEPINPADSDKSMKITRISCFFMVYYRVMFYLKLMFELLLKKSASTFYR